MILSPQKQYFPSKKPPMAVKLDDKPKGILDPNELRFVIFLSFVAGFTGGCASIAMVTFWLWSY